MTDDQKPTPMTRGDLDKFIRDAVTRMCAEAGESMIPRMLRMFDLEEHKLAFLRIQYPGDGGELDALTPREQLLIDRAVAYTLAMLLPLDAWVALMENQGVVFTVDNSGDKSDGAEGGSAPGPPLAPGIG